MKGRLEINDNYKRIFPIGAEYNGGKGASFRLWAPGKENVKLYLSDKLYSLEKEENGYFSLFISGVAEGELYGYLIENDEKPYPDPASRFQPEGPFGLSMIVNSNKYKWKTNNWKGTKLKGAVIYEMHIGTFTQEGTWKAAQAQLPELAEVGITCLEIMPIADFPGNFGWGYDGVNLFAPTRLYGSCDDLKEFIDTAHSLNMGVILDVVYNHLGPSGNFITKFNDYYISEKHETDWGKGLNYDGENCKGLREFILTNVKYWLTEYRFDGFRIDATQDIHDNSEVHILNEIASEVNNLNNGKILIGENEPQNAELITPAEEGGCGLDAVWNDDFHHSAFVAITGVSLAYYTDYKGKPQELLSSIKYGYLFQGQYYKWQKKRRGSPTLNIPREKFIVYLQNHDQIANIGFSYRLDKLTSPSRLRAITTLMLLVPSTPLLFMGQEFNASTEFNYFADHEEELNKIVFEGRKKFMSQFINSATTEMQQLLKKPSDKKSFLESKLKFDERRTNQTFYNMVKELLKIRKNDPVIKLQGEIDGAILAEEAFVLRYFGGEKGDRLLVVNLGLNINEMSIAEPLMAPAVGKEWELIFSTEDPKYGGQGTPPLETQERIYIPAHSALLLKS
jgi:maltooligosyltrehalose trehalohydrolase